MTGGGVRWEELRMRGEGKGNKHWKARGGKGTWDSEGRRKEGAVRRKTDEGKKGKRRRKKGGEEREKGR